MKSFKVEIFIRILQAISWLSTVSIFFVNFVTSFLVDRKLFYLKVPHPLRILLFPPWLLELFTQIQYSEIIFVYCSAKKSFNFYEVLMKSYQVEAELLIFSQKRHLKMKTMIITTKLRTVLKLPKLKHLWDQR